MSGSIPISIIIQFIILFSGCKFKTVNWKYWNEATSIIDVGFILTAGETYPDLSYHFISDPEPYACPFGCKCPSQFIGSIIIGVLSLITFIALIYTLSAQHSKKLCDRYFWIPGGVALTLGSCALASLGGSLGYFYSGCVALSIYMTASSFFFGVALMVRDVLGGICGGLSGMILGGCIGLIFDLHYHWYQSFFTSVGSMTGLILGVILGWIPMAFFLRYNKHLDKYGWSLVSEKAFHAVIQLDEASPAPTPRD